MRNGRRPRFITNGGIATFKQALCTSPGGAAGIVVGQTGAPGTLYALGAVAVLDYQAAAAAIAIGPGSQLVADECVWASSAVAGAIGMDVQGGGSLRYAAGFVPDVDEGGAAPPTIKFQIGGVAKVKADLPWPNPANGAYVVLKA